MPIIDEAKLQKLISEYSAAPERFAFFTGAGMSVPVFPPWSKLLRDMVENCHAQGILRADRDELLGYIDSGSYFLEIARTCAESFGPTQYRGVLEDVFQVDLDSAVVPEAYLKLFELNPGLVLTTNYDRLPEVATGGQYNTFTNRQASEALRAIEKGRRVIFKLHGDIGDSKTIVFTAADYQQIVHNNTTVSNFIRSILSTRTIVFLGFSLADPHINLVLDNLMAINDGLPINHFAVVAEQSAFKVESIEKRYGLTVIRYQASDNSHPEVPELLDALRGETPAEGREEEGTLTDRLPLHLEQVTGHQEYMLNTPSEDHIHISIVSRAQTESEIQKEILAVLRGARSPDGQRSVITLFIHARTPPMPDFMAFYQSMLIVRVETEAAIEYAVGRVSGRKFWQKLRFYTLQYAGLGHESYVPVGFPYIGVD